MSAAETQPPKEEKPAEEKAAAEKQPTKPATDEKPAAENNAEEEEDDELTVDLDALPKMKVSELKDILKALDLPTSGIKTTLIERIQEHFAEEDKQEGGKTEETKQKKTEGTPEEEELLKEETSQPASDFIKLDKKTTEKTEATETKLTTDTKTDEEKKEIRAAKFGIDTDKSVESKKLERAAKFGVDTPETAAQKKAKRSERFGAAARPKLSVTTEDITKDDEKLKKRAARFNIGADAPSPKVIKYDIAEVLKDKIEKTGKTTVDLSAAALSLEERKKMRALKFGA